MNTDDYIWLPLSEVAREFHKSPRTMLRWVSSGFIFTLGYRVHREISGNFLIGMPPHEYTGNCKPRRIRRNPLSLSL